MGSVVVGQHDGRAGHTPTQLSALTCFFAAHRWDDHREPSPLENLHTTTDSEAEEQQKSEDWTKVRESHRVGLSGRVEKDEEEELGASKLHDWCDKQHDLLHLVALLVQLPLSVQSHPELFWGRSRP